MARVAATGRNGEAAANSGSNSGSIKMASTALSSAAPIVEFCKAESVEVGSCDAESGVGSSPVDSLEALEGSPVGGIAEEMAGVELANKSFGLMSRPQFQQRFTAPINSAPQS